MARSIELAKHDALANRVSWVFVVAAFCVTMSQNVLAPNLTAASESFGLSALERDTIFGGWMSTCFFVIGGPLSLFIGSMVDVTNRKQLLLWVMAACNVVVILTAVATEVWQMLALRAALGAAHGAIVPILYSIFGDLFPPSKRSTVSAIIGTAWGGGLMSGQVLAGLMGAAYGWRSPYVCIAILGTFALVLVFVKGEEPARGVCGTG